MDEIDYDGDGTGADIPSFKFSRPSESAPSWPPFIGEKKRESKWGFWALLKNEYGRIIDNPKLLPEVAHPMISKQRQFTFAGPYKKHFLNVKMDLPDERGVVRRLYFHFCKEHFVVGAFSGLLIGASTGFFTPAAHYLTPFLAQKRLMGKPVKALAIMAFSGTMMTATFSRRLILRTAIGGILYDALKRYRDEKDYLNQLMNAGYAGGLTGFALGLRAGIPHAWAAAAVTSTVAVLSEFVPWKFKDTEK